MILNQSAKSSIEVYAAGALLNVAWTALRRIVRFVLVHMGWRRMFKDWRAVVIAGHFASSLVCYTAASMPRERFGCGLCVCTIMSDRFGRASAGRRNSRMAGGRRSALDAHRLFGEGSWAFCAGRYHQLYIRKYTFHCLPLSSLYSRQVQRDQSCVKHTITAKHVLLVRELHTVSCCSISGILTLTRRCLVCTFRFLFRACRH